MKKIKDYCHRIIFQFLPLS